MKKYQKALLGMGRNGQRDRRRTESATNEKEMKGLIVRLAGEGAENQQKYSEYTEHQPEPISKVSAATAR